MSCLYLTITPTMQRHRSLCLCFTQKTSIFHLKYKTKDIADVCLCLWQKSPIEFVFPLQLSTKIYCAKTHRDVILDFLSYNPFFLFIPSFRSVLKWHCVHWPVTGRCEYLHFFKWFSFFIYVCACDPKAWVSILMSSVPLEKGMQIQGDKIKCKSSVSQRCLM